MDRKKITKMARIPLERIGSPFVVRNWDKVSRREARIHTPRTLEDRIHFLREGSTGQLSRKRHRLNRTLSSAHQRKAQARSSVAVLSKVNAWAKHAIANQKEMHAALAGHLQHHHHQVMLEDAIKSGKVSKLRAIVAHCGEHCVADGFRASEVVCGAMHNGDPYLIAAVAKQRLEMARQLLAMGADVNTVGQPPGALPCIIYAALSGYVAMIELLISHGAVLTEHDLRLTKQKCGYAQRGRSLRNEESVRLWLHKFWSRKLLSAAQQNDAAAVLCVLALNERASIYNERDHKRNAPIHIAAANDNATMVRLMLTHSKKTLSLTNGSYLTPLQCALFNDSLSAARFLMAKGARMDSAATRKMLEAHAASDENTKMENIGAFAEIVLRCVAPESEAPKIMPALSAHLKKLNSSSPTVLRAVLETVAATTFADYAKQHNFDATPHNFDGKHALRDELIRKHNESEQAERAKMAMLKAQTQKERRPATTGAVPMRHARSAQVLVGRPQTLFRKSQLRRLKTSRSLPQLNASNIYISQTHASKMLQIAQTIRTARVVFAQKLDSIIDHNVARMKSQRATAPNLKRRRSRRTTTMPKMNLAVGGKKMASAMIKARRASCF